MLNLKKTKLYLIEATRTKTTKGVAEIHAVSMQEAEELFNENPASYFTSARDEPDWDYTLYSIEEKMEKQNVS